MRAGEVPDLSRLPLAPVGAPPPGGKGSGRIYLVAPHLIDNRGNDLGYGVLDVNASHMHCV